MDMGGEHLPVIDGSDAGREHSKGVPSKIATGKIQGNWGSIYGS